MVGRRRDRERQFLDDRRRGLEGSTWTETLVDEVIFALSGSSPTDVWAVTNDRDLGHFDGATWTWTAVPTTVFTTAVAATGPSDVYVGGSNGFLIRYDGARWWRITSNTGAHILGLAIAPDGIIALLEAVLPDAYHHHYVSRLVRTYPWP